VWMSYAAFEASIVGSIDGARRVYRRAYEHFKSLGTDAHEPRALILETWKAFEESLLQDDLANGGHGAAFQAPLDAVTKLQPKRVVRRRPLYASDNTTPIGSEEYHDYLFPDDETKPSNLKLLELAQRWKKSGGSAALPATTEPQLHTVAGEKREFETDADGDDSAAPRPAKQARLSEHTFEIQQSTYAETEDGDDPERGKEHEKELEDAVHNAQHLSEIPRDLYTEEDAGDAADRDP
jgi:hypothetical protein